jgi:hypothetical protein
MPVLVSVRGKEYVHPNATHYIASPTNLCHVYTGDTPIATYHQWDYAYLGKVEDQPIEVPKAAETVPRGGFGATST